MHEKTVRRRRAVLALLVALSLILISASFGSSGGGLHTVQSGFLNILSPIESGANKVLTPVHDLFKWVDDVVNATNQRDHLKKVVASLETKLTAAQALTRENAGAAALLGLDRRDHLGADRPVTANVISWPQSVFNAAVTIDAGSGRGIHAGDPVINGNGLIGTVTRVASDGATVTLIDDPSVKVGARDNVSGDVGLIAPEAGDPSLLQLQYVHDVTTLHVGDQIVTAGGRQTNGASLYPPNILIGTVKSLPAAGSGGAATVTPAANLGALDAVQVLTRVTP